MRTIRLIALVSPVLLALAFALSLRVAPLAYSATATPTPSTTAKATTTPAPAATTAPVASPTPQPPADPLALLNAEIAARNRGDITAALALFADNATFTTAACQPCTTKADIAATLQRLVSDHYQITALSNQVSGNTVSGKASVTSDSIRARGIQRIIVNESLTAQNGLITSFTSAPDPTDAQTMQFLMAATGPGPNGLPSTGAASATAPLLARWLYLALTTAAAGAVLAALGAQRLTAARRYPARR